MAARNSRTTKRLPRKKLTVEQLEARRLMAGLWSYIEHSQVPSNLTSFIRAEEYKLATLDTASIQSQLSAAPTNLVEPAIESTILSIPTPDGTFERFNVYVTSIMAPELAAKFPEIQTYAGQGIDNPASTVFFDLTPQGFHAQVRSPAGTYYVDPYSNLSREFYAVYAKGTSKVDTGFRELGGELNQLRGDGVSDDSGSSTSGSILSRSGTQLRTYRLAVAATGEYTRFHGGTVPTGQAAIVTAVNRIAGIYQTELAVTFQLVANNDRLVFTDPATDGYTNNNGFAMLGENQAIVDRIIGNANYDIGHVFSTGGGGVAALSSVGVNAIKAQGVTGLPTPIGDEFYVDYVAHEVGHQFGGNHTFNGVAGNCPARNGSTAYEPGSGTTIQAYAGICATDDLQTNSDPYFHSVSLDEMVRHVDVTIPNVGTRVATGNAIPVINAGLDYVIPARTPFVLTAVGSDANPGDQLTYDWQQRDLGPARSVNLGDDGVGPLFRVWIPTATPSRTFPRLSDLVNNVIAKGERLPTTTRQLNFRVVARDNRAAAGAFDDDNMRISVIDTGTSFAVVTPNTNVSWEGLTFQNIEWDVAGTSGNGINALNVDISLSTDGGLTYPSVLASRVPNNGSANVRIANIPTSSARVRVQGSNNIFFDISNTNFTITPATRSIDIVLGPNVAYVENSDPVFVASAPKVNELNIPSYDGAILTLSVGNNFQVGDVLALANEGTGAGEISVVGNQISLGPTAIGTFTGSGRTIDVTFNAATNSAAIEKLLSRATFVHTTDDPSPSPRAVTAYLDNGQNGASNRATVLVNVTPVNDAPRSSNATLATINEDTANPAGVAIGLLVGPSFQDPDRGSSLSGIAITSNIALTTLGRWQYSLNGTTWLPVGTVVPATSLALAATTQLRFLPGKDYFGRPTALSFRALDETYSGGFTAATRTTIDVSAATATGAIALTDASIGIQISPVNDAPIATVADQVQSINEDEAFSFQIPSSWFIDVDNATLMLSVNAADGSSLPNWLAFDALTRRLTGLPSNNDVGNHDLVIVATDAEGLFANVNLQIVVVNVNDAPTNISLSRNSVIENEPGSFIGNLIATDQDRIDQFVWEVFDQRFAVLEDKLFLAPGVRLNYETTRFVEIQIKVTDNGNPPLSLTLQKTIDVLDVNEFAPLLKAAQFNVSEATLGGSEIAFLVALDGDTDNIVKYKISGTPPTLFSIDGNTGRITLNATAKLDHESVAAYQFLVEAFDDGLPSLSSTASVSINVTDVNEFDPIITNSLISISERQLVGIPFAKLIASDGDTSQTVRFLLPSSETRFTLNPNNGDLTLKRVGTFDFETSKTDSIVVIAEDSGSPVRRVEKTLSMLILDANDPPTAATVANPSVLSNISGLSLGKLTIADQDPGQLYTVVSSDDRFTFLDGDLILAPGKGVLESDPVQMVVPIQVTEVGGEGKSYSLNVALTRISNKFPWQNQLNPQDVNRVGGVNPLDALAVINAINAGELGRLPFPRPASSISLPDYDVDGDGTLSPLDVLSIINSINNRASGEGESKFEVAPIQRSKKIGGNDAAWLAAYTQIEEERLTLRRRRS